MAKTLEQANAIVSEHTAFSTYYELTEAMARHGYVPTVSLRRQGELVRLLNERGLRAFVTR